MLLETTRQSQHGVTGLVALKNQDVQLVIGAISHSKRSAEAA